MAGPSGEVFTSTCQSLNADTAAYSYFQGPLDKKWKPVSLTFVEYPEDDLLGKCLAWCSLIPIFIIVGFITLVLFRRELHTITFFSGLLLNEGVNWFLKYMIQQPRPCTRNPDTLYNEHGMPSSHAQFMTFFGVYAILFIYLRLHSQSANLVDNLWKHGICLVVIAADLVVCASRIYLRYHTFSQVFWGFIVGGFLAGPWFVLTQTLFTPLFPTIVAWPVSEMLMIRDSTKIPSVMWFEYTTARAEARNRQRRGSYKSS